MEPDRRYEIITDMAMISLGEDEVIMYDDPDYEVEIDETGFYKVTEPEFKKFFDFENSVQSIYIKNLSKYFL